MSEGSERERGFRWWMRYVIVPLIGGGGIVAIVVAILSNRIFIAPHTSTPERPAAILPSGTEQPPDSTPDVKATVAAIVSATLASQPIPTIPDVPATVTAAAATATALASRPTPPIPDVPATVTAAVATALASQPTPAFSPAPTPGDVPLAL